MSTSDMGHELNAGSEQYSVSEFNDNWTLTSRLLFNKGANIASANTLTLPTTTNQGQFHHVTGTTEVRAADASTSGRTLMLVFDGILQLTHNGTSWILPTGANITTAAGDVFVMRADGTAGSSTSNYRCVSYTRASGAALAIANESVDSDAYVDGSIDAAHIASNAVTTVKINADAVTAAKIADDALDSEHYTDGSIDAAHLASNAVTTVKINADAVTAAKIADDALDSEHYTDGSIDAAHLASSSVTTAKINDDAVTLAKLAGGTDGELITWDASGDPAAVAVGTSTHVLTSNGSGAAPTFQAAAGGGKLDQVMFTSGATGATTSTSYADVSGGEVDITTDKGGLMVWYFLSGYNNTTSGNTYIALQLDSTTEVAQSQVTQNLGNQDYVYSGFYTWTGVSDAAHELNIRMKVGSGTFTIRGGAILVMEFDD
jgi:hypothetical protein